MLKISPALITQMVNVDIHNNTWVYLHSTCAVEVLHLPFCVFIAIAIIIVKFIIIAFLKTDWFVSDNILPTIQPLWPY